MPYELKIDYPLDFFSNADEIPVSEQTRIIEALEMETDFSKKLVYYNAHVCSLALEPSWATLSYPSSGHLNAVEIYHDCNNINGVCSRCCTPEQREIYLQHRATEVERVVRELNSRVTYEARLRYFSQIIGSHPENGLTGIWANWPGVTDFTERHKRLSVFDSVDELPLIDLAPNTPQEIEVFNRFIETLFAAKYKTAEGIFTKYWKGFDFEKAKQKLDTTIAKALDPQIIVEKLREHIETHFGYLRPHNEVEVDVWREKIRIAPNERGETHFLSMVNGLDNGLNLSAKRLMIYDFESYEHAQQSYFFYVYLRKIQDGTLEVKEPEIVKNNLTGTTAQQVLAIYYLLQAANMPAGDKSNVARFTEFLTGKNYKNIYDAVRSPIATKAKGELRMKDLQFVRTHFENLGLTEIVQMINNELTTPNN